MDITPYVPLMLPATIFSLAAVAHVLGSLETQAEARQASRVARIEGTVSRLAAEAATDLSAAKAAGTAADALNAMKAAAVATGASYIQTAMPDTVSKAGATKESLITMLSGEVSKQQIVAEAPALLTAAAGTIMASAAAPPASPAAGDQAAAAT